MCIYYQRIHRGCGYPAKGTCSPADRVELCHIGITGELYCKPGTPLLQEEVEYVSRDYYDTCIISSIMVMKVKGITDLDTVARSMSVGINDLMRANPLWRPLISCDFRERIERPVILMTR